MQIQQYIKEALIAIITLFPTSYALLYWESLASSFPMYDEMREVIFVLSKVELVAAGTMIALLLFAFLFQGKKASRGKFYPRLILHLFYSACFFLVLIGTNNEAVNTTIWTVVIFVLMALAFTGPVIVGRLLTNKKR